MDQTIGDTGLRGSLQLSGNVITAGHDVNVTVSNPDSMLIRLKNLLNPVTSASYDSFEAGQRSECFPNTRVKVLNDIEKWVKGESHQAPIYLLYGVAGIGKSTVAQTIAAKAAALGLLGASYFFSRDEDLRTVAKHFFPTIAYQISRHNNSFATQISRSLDGDPDIPAKLLNQQLTLLILEPLQNLLSQKSTPTLIVVDALDECDEKGAEELLTLLGNHVHQIKGLKILITTRPEVHLRHVLRQDGSHEKFCLHEIEESVVKSDIRLYLRFHLSAKEIRKVPRHRDTTWQPTDREMRMLCGICGTLFIIAATATKFILGSNFTPQKQLSRFLDGVSRSDFVGSKYNKALDHTYIRVICAALSEDDEIDREWLKNLNRVLGGLISLANPVPCSALALLLEMDQEDIEATLSQLHSLVAPTGKGADMAFRIHHKSFPDFITNRERIRQALTIWKTDMYPGLDSLLWIDVIDQHLQLAKACFRAMDRGLKRNMANINKEDWYKDMEDIPHIRPDLIPRELAYAAMHWATHLRSAEEVNENLELQMYLDRWASRHILSWMEVMVILDKVNDIYGILQDAIKCLPDKCAADEAQTKQKNATELLLDACRFVQQGGEVMKISPMHIYRSCLPFVPIATSIYKVYGDMAMLKGCVGKRYKWDPLVATLIGHSYSVNSVAFSADGSRVASGSDDNTVRLWDANTGAHLSTLAGHSDSVNSVAFSADGSKVTSGSDDTTVRLWDASTGAHPSTLAGHSYRVKSVAFTTDGSRVASGSDDTTVRLWDANTGAHLSTLAGHSHWVKSVAFTTDGSRVASGSNDKTVRLWDANTGAHLSTLTGHSDWVKSVAFTTDGSRVASGSDDKTVRLWDANTGAHLSTLAGHSDSVNSVAFTTDGSRVASGSNDKTVRLWDANTGAHLSTLTGHSYRVNSVAFSADGSRVVSGSNDNTVQLWDANTGAHLSTLAGHSHRVNSVAFSADGSKVASGSDDTTVRLWDASTGAHPSTLTGHSYRVNSVAFSADGSRVASGSDDKTVQLWDANTGANLSTLAGDSYRVNSVAFSADGSRVASGSDDYTVQLWNAKTGALRSTLTGHLYTVNSVAFSADGSKVASGSNDTTVRLWDASTGAHPSTLTGHSYRVNSVAFSVDGSKVASGSDDNTVRLWDANTGAHLSTLAGHSDSVNSVAFTTDGSRVASGSNDKTVRLWDANTGAHLSTLTGHSYRVNSVAFSADGSRVVSGSNDNTVRLWDANTRAHLSTLAGHSHWVKSVAFSADGSRVASGSDDNTVRRWDANFNTRRAHLSPLILPAVSSNNSQQIDQIISPGSQARQYSDVDSTSLLLLVSRKNPSITGIMAATLVMEGEHDFRWAVDPVCWFPPDIKASCMSVDQLNSRMAIGCDYGHVMTLNF